MLTREDNERLCRTGPGTPMGNLLRRFWLPALLPSEVSAPDSPPKRLRILGEDLVAFRDSTGRVGIVEAYCPHKGALLFWGRNEDCGLRCAYHGWKFDADGRCIEIPNVPNSENLQRKIGLTAYPTREAGGVVWIYMGPADKMPDLPALEWTELDDEQIHISRWLQCSNWAQGMEGEIDTTHINFLHSAVREDLKLQPPFSASTPDVVPGPPTVTVRETAYGMVYGARRRTETDAYFWRITQWLVPMFSLIANQSYPRGGRAWVPVDDEHVTTFAYMFNAETPLTKAHREALGTGFLFPPRTTQGAHALPDGYIIDTFLPVANSGNDYQIDRDLQVTGNFTGISGVNAQDRAIQETMRSPPGAGPGAFSDRTREWLVASDAPVITARKILLGLAEALEKGIEPPQPGDGDLYRVRAIAAVSTHASLDDFLEAYREPITVAPPA